MIVFLIVIGLSFIIGIGFCIYAIRKRSLKLIDNNLKYFDKHLPKFKIKQNDELLT